MSLHSSFNLPPKVWRRTPIGKYLRLIPRKKQLKGTWLHRKLGDKLLRTEYWEPSIESISKGFAIGSFWAMIPMPFQMVPSGICAVLFRANVPLALLGVWVTNPITHPFVMVFQLFLGEWLLNAPSSLNVLENQGFIALLHHAPAPFLTGVLVCAVVWSTAGFFISRLCYKIATALIAKSYERRRAR
ncbi:MAG: DUF2062 domain-containing protein [Helicobacteraceae bacterium]|nr:DUF2062 domain-containing protein [Helicobacteraceae bacterium]